MVKVVHNTVTLPNMVNIIVVNQLGPWIGPFDGGRILEKGIHDTILVTSCHSEGVLRHNSRKVIKIIFGTDSERLIINKIEEVTRYSIEEMESRYLFSELLRIECHEVSTGS